LGALAASLGLPVAVAETPTARPIRLRPRRLVHKQHAGATVGVLNHVPTGAQDYYPAMYGGVNAIELSAGGIARKAMPVDPNDLDERIVLAYTGAPRNSGVNNWEVTKLHIDGDRQVWRNFDRIAAIAHAMRGAMERSDWTEVGGLLRQEWEHRRKNAPGISTPLIDRLISATRRAGALGAKACGAGGGGCLVFVVEAGAKQAVSAIVEREGARVLAVKPVARGVRIREVV